MWSLRVDPQIFMDFWNWTQNFHIGFGSALRFDGCNHTHMPVHGSGPGNPPWLSKPYILTFFSEWISNLNRVPYYFYLLNHRFILAHKIHLLKG